MTENALTAAVRAFVEKTVSGFAYTTPGGSAKAPVVINGFMPPKRDAKDDFPFIVILPVKGSTEADRTEVDLRIEIGVWSEEFAGYEYALNVMARIRTALASLPALTLAGKYRVVQPTTWEMDDEQPYPGWLVTMTTTWEMYAPDAADPDKEETYGYFRD